MAKGFFGNFLGTFSDIFLACLYNLYCNYKGISTMKYPEEASEYATVTDSQTRQNSLSIFVGFVKELIVILTL